MRKLTFIVGYWPRRSRYSRSRYGRGPSKVSLIFFSLVLLVAILALTKVPIGEEISSAVASVVGEVSLSDRQLKSVFEEGLPVLQLEDATYKSPISLAASLLSNVTMVNLGTPKDLLESQYSYLEEMEIEAVTIPYGETEVYEGDKHLAPENPGAHEQNSATDLDGQQEKQGKLAGEDGVRGANSGDKALVGLYTTHNGERYVNEKKSKGQGEEAGVVRVVQVMETTLRDQYQVPAVKSTQVHDYPNWNQSYTKSKETAKSLLSKNPSIQILVDVHRDAGLKKKQTVTINGKSAAKVLLIVGSDQRMKNPDWKKNKEFADLVDAKMDELYPGLSRGVRVQTGRYNQHLHPRAILLEMGNEKNPLTEAEVSAELMAHVFSEVLNDLSAKQL